LRFTIVRYQISINIDLKIGNVAYERFGNVDVDISRSPGTLADVPFILMYPVEDDTKETYVGIRSASTSSKMVRNLSFCFTINPIPHLNNSDTVILVLRKRIVKKSTSLNSV